MAEQPLHKDDQFVVITAILPLGALTIHASEVVRRWVLERGGCRVLGNVAEALKHEVWARSWIHGRSDDIDYSKIEWHVGVPMAGTEV